MLTISNIIYALDTLAVKVEAFGVGETFVKKFQRITTKCFKCSNSI